MISKQSKTKQNKTTQHNKIVNYVLVLVTSTEYSDVLSLNNTILRRAGFGFDFARGMSSHVGDMELSEKSRVSSAGMQSPGGLLDSLLNRGVSSDAALQLIQAYYSAAGEMYKAQSREPFDEDSSVGGASPASSRTSRRSVRRQLYMQQCIDFPVKAGYCYLLLVNTSLRKLVADRIGAYPDILQLLSIRAEELDMDALRNIQFATNDGYRYHVETKQNGNALDMLRRTLGVYKSHGASMRSRIGVDDTIGDFFPQDSTFGAPLDDIDVGMSAQEEIQEQVLTYDSLEDMTESNDILRDMIQRRIPMSVVYHWPAEEAIEPAKPAMGCAALCTPVADGDTMDGLHHFDFPGVIGDSLLVLPAGVFVKDQDVIVGSATYVTSIVVTSRSSLRVLWNERLADFGKSFSSRVVKKYGHEPGIWLDVIPLRGINRDDWKLSSFYVDARITDLRYASNISSFTVFAVPYGQMCVGVFRGGTRDVVHPDVRDVRFDDFCTLPVTGNNPVSFSMDDHRFGKMRLVEKVKFTASWHSVTLAYVVKILSSRSRVTVNTHRVQPVLSVYPVSDDILTFHYGGMKFRSSV